MKGNERRVEPTTGLEPSRCEAGGLDVSQVVLANGEGGAGNGVRTRDIQLGRLTLYQLSYSRG